MHARRGEAKCKLLNCPSCIWTALIRQNSLALPLQIPLLIWYTLAQASMHLGEHWLQPRGSVTDILTLKWKSPEIANTVHERPLHVIESSHVRAETADKFQGKCLQPLTVA